MSLWQIHGGNGFSAEYAISRAYRDSRINRIYEGTNEINRLLTVDMILKRAMKGRLDLMGSAMAVQKELMSIPDFGSGDDEPFASERKLVANMKKALLILIPLTGKRVVPFTWLPDWHNSVNDSYEWVTDVLTSYDGSEQRRGVRKYPRRTIEFSPFAAADDRRNFESTLFGWGSKTFAVPVWQDQRSLASSLSSGSTSIS